MLFLTAGLQEASTTLAHFLNSHPKLISTLKRLLGEAVDAGNTVGRCHVAPWRLPRRHQKTFSTACYGHQHLFFALRHLIDDLSRMLTDMAPSYVSSAFTVWFATPLANARYMRAAADRISVQLAKASDFRNHSVAALPVRNTCPTPLAKAMKIYLESPVIV